jgi:hypothetical protein
MMQGKKLKWKRTVEDGVYGGTEVTYNAVCDDEHFELTSITHNLDGCGNWGHKFMLDVSTDGSSGIFLFNTLKKAKQVAQLIYEG